MSLKDTVQKGVEKVKEIAGRFARPKSPRERKIERDRLYNYGAAEDRVATAMYLLPFAQAQRAEQARIWQMCEDYYNNRHDAQLEYADWCKEQNIPWLPAVVPDPFIHCESQIVPDVPDFEFRGRDDDADSRMARIRQYVVQYIADNNNLVIKNTRAERRLVKYGDTEWKVGFDFTHRMGNYQGDIFIRDLPTGYLIYDPVAVEMDDCEYVGYAYPMHRMAAQRMFARDLKRLGLGSLDRMGGMSVPLDLELNSEQADVQDDIVQVVEFWFRQPADGSETVTWEHDGEEKTETVEWEAGDIACSIIVNETELRYIPCYWRKTHRQNKMYPFVKYCRVPKEGSIYGYSEIEPIKELVDAADRELAAALLNDAMMANDIIVVEEGALADGEEVKSAPGSVVKLKDGRSNGIKRLGGLSTQNMGLDNQMQVIREIIKQTSGNFDVNMGDAPPANVNTLGGLVELREQGNKRQSLKRADRMTGFERLYRLVDYTAIEFYDDDRIIFLGAKGKGNPEPTAAAGAAMPGVAEPPQETPGTPTGLEGMPPAAAPPVGGPAGGILGAAPNMDRTAGPVRIVYNSENFKKTDRRGKEYYPVVDCVIDVGEGVKNSRGMTISATENIAKMNVTQQNYKVVQELIKLLEIPNAKDLCDFYEQQFGPQAQAPQGMPAAGGAEGMLPGLQSQLPPDIEQMLAAMPPEMQAAVLQEFLNGGGAPGGGAPGMGGGLPI